MENLCKAKLRRWLDKLSVIITLRWTNQICQVATAPGFRLSRLSIYRGCRLAIKTAENLDQLQNKFLLEVCQMREMKGDSTAEWGRYHQSSAQNTWQTGNLSVIRPNKRSFLDFLCFSAFKIPQNILSHFSWPKLLFPNLNCVGSCVCDVPTLAGLFPVWPQPCFHKDPRFS